jgi:uncharacterized protein YndB with AHSA1/START domain
MEVRRMTTETDRIERDVLIAAPIERVWELATRPEHLGRWFADAGARVDLRPGGELSLTWREYGTVHGRVEAVDPPHRVAYRWMAEPGSQAEPTPANSTLIEFTFTAEDDATRVAVVETGFDGLGTDVEGRTAAFASHTEGWAFELDELVAYAHGVAAGR